MLLHLEGCLLLLGTGETVPTLDVTVKSGPCPPPSRDSKEVCRQGTISAIDFCGPPPVERALPNAVVVEDRMRDKRGDPAADTRIGTRFPEPTPDITVSSREVSLKGVFISPDTSSTAADLHLGRQYHHTRFCCYHTIYL